LGNPVGLVAALTGGGSIFTDQALFFSGAALVTFGGAYAVLAYVAQKAVEVYGWLAPGEMTRGLALAETTPGRSSWWCSSWRSSALRTWSGSAATTPCPPP
jgi:chromate transporter